MYEYFDFNPENVLFEWDEEKEEANFKKHGIHFKTAAKVFFDPDKLIRRMRSIYRKIVIIFLVKWEKFFS